MMLKMSNAAPRVPHHIESSAIWWIRRDLRLQDNAALVAAASSTHLVPCYVLDPRDLEPRRLRDQGGLGVPKLGPHRCRFIIESLHCLKQQLVERGSDLLFHIGQPEILIPQIACQIAEQEALQHIALHYHSDVMPESWQQEDDVQQALERAMQQTGVSTSIHRHWGLTLYHPDDLPSAGSPEPRSDAQQALRHSRDISAAAAGIPDVMTNFRKAVHHAPVRQLLPAPPVFPQLPSSFRAGTAPSPQLPSDSACPQTTGLACSPSCPDAGPPAARARLTCGPLPSAVMDVYEQAGARAVEALGVLCSMTGIDPATFPPPGQFDARSAFQLHAGPTGGLDRLRWYTRGSHGGSSEAAAPPAGGAQAGGGRAEGGASDARSSTAAGPELPNAANSERTCPPSPRSCDPEPQPAGPPLARFVASRALAHGQDNSTKLSPFLAQGCLSPRQVHWEVSGVKRDADKLGIPDAACEQLVMHLQIRDFYLFTALKHGSAVLEAGGLKRMHRQWDLDEELFLSWAQGRTGVPFVDACMRELAATGWMSNRGRQCVSSFLSKTLKQDWTQGAELFESLLLDHDLGVNYVNWNYFAGVGNDPRDRHFKVISQGIQYDEHACLITKWIPALAGLPLEFKHKPFMMTAEQQETLGCKLGVDYPHPLVDPLPQIGVLKQQGTQEGRSHNK